MNIQSDRTESSQRGFSLVEVLIAVAIFAVIFIAALLMYDRSTGVFKRGVEAADSQQNTRVAFDRLAGDLRMAGFDYDRDGFPSGSVGTTWADGRAYGLNVVVVPTVSNGFSYRATTAGTSGGFEPVWPTVVDATVNDNGIIWKTLSGNVQAQQPDEQIEYAGPAAITIRANFDFESDAANDNGREGPLRDGGTPLAPKPSYESSQFPVVTTGNDEIVTYALRSRDASKNTGSVTFFADVNPVGTAPSRTSYPGGNPERLVTIPSVDLTNANPPYTLFRFTLDDEANVVATPLAENIRSLNFLYYMDNQGVTPLRNLADVAVPDGSTVLGAGQYNPATPGILVAGRAVRTRIKSVRMQLVGMNEQPDPAFTDPIETVASAVPYRKYRLETLIVPRNLGKRGLREQDTTPPGKPILTNVWFGHCGIAKVEWEAPVDGGPVEQYTILYDNDGDPSDGYAFTEQVGNALFGYVPVYSRSVANWHMETWEFRVQAVSSFGNGLESDAESGIPLNRTKPEPISGLTTAAGTNNIILTWQRPDDNVVGDLLAVPSGSVTTEGPLPAREPLFYEVYRSDDINFTPDGSNRIHDGFAAGAAQTTVATGVVTFTDNTAVNCKDYYYRVRVRDLCGDGPMNVPGRTGIGDYFPPTGSSAILGTNPGTGRAPAAPSNLIIDLATSSCNGTNCTVNLSWPAVTTDTDGDTVAIETYVVRAQKKNGLSDVGTPETTVVTVDPTTATVTAMVTTVADPGSTPPPSPLFTTYELTVVAEQCSLQSAPSPSRLFPCTFAGGTPNPTIADAVDGSGSSSNPYLVFGTSSITVSGLAGSASVTATLYKNASIVSPASSYGVVGGVAVIPIGDPDDDGSLYRAEITIQDGAGCIVTRTVYYLGSVTNCCLILQSVTGVSAGNDKVTVTVRNQCTSNVVMNATGSARMHFSDASFPSTGAPARLDKIQWPQAGGGITPATVPNSKYSAGAIYSHNASDAASVDYTIEAGTNYSIRFDFTRLLNSSTSPIRDLCISYGVSPTTVCKIIDDGFTPSCP